MLTLKNLWKIALFVAFSTNYNSLKDRKPENLISHLEYLTSNYPQEKVYLHTDKSIYSLGEILWFKAYLKNATDHTAFTPSSLVYVELINPYGELVDRWNIKIRKDWDHGSINLNKEWDAGYYTIKAFTSYMCNFAPEFIFQKKIFIGDPFNKPGESKHSEGELKIEFYPEGGQLVEGLKSVVAFRAVNNEGEGLIVSGSIVDESETTVTTLQTYRPGYGSFILTPHPNTVYYAEIVQSGEKKKYKIPLAENKGYVLQVSNLHPEHMIVSVYTNSDKGLKDCFLLGHIRGNPVTMVRNLEGNKATFKIPKVEMDEGILHLTLFNRDGNPECERLVYIHSSEKKIDTKLSIPYAYYGRRQEAIIDITLNNESGQGVTADLSASITDAYTVPHPEWGINIENYMLLLSDLVSPVAEPHLYLEDTDPKKAYLLDMAMLTHGWRRFSWKDIKDKKDPHITHPPQSGFDFSGTIFKKDRPHDASLYVSLISDQFDILELNADNDGRFIMEEVAMWDSTNVVFQANNEKDKKEKNITVIVDEMEVYSPFSYNTFINEVPGKESLERYLLSSLENERLDSFYQVDFSIDLEEVTVTTSRADIDRRLKKERNIPYSEVDNRLLIDSLKFVQPYYTVFDIVRLTVPGVEVVGTPYVDQEFRIRGNNSISLPTTAQVLINGAPVSTGTVNALRAADIEFIDVLKGLSKTAVFGGNGSNGVVAIYTRSGRTLRGRNKKVEGLFNMMHPGYHKARTFPSPDYSITLPEHLRPDFRTTLYWDPTIHTDSTGKAQLKFFTGDRYSTYRVDLQGMAEDGSPVVKKLLFDVKE